MTPRATIRLTRAQVRDVDRISIERYGIPGIVLMENAARGAADVACEMLWETRQWPVPAGASPLDVTGFTALILCGGGNNGGDGLAIARHLHNRGCNVRVALTVDPATYKGDAATNWNIVRAMELACAPFDSTHIGGPDLIIDAVFGTGLIEAPREPFDRIAAAVNSSGRPVLAIDLPSGLDCDTGRPLGPACIRATRTVTFVAEKTGFTAPEASLYLGQVWVADIGCPLEIIKELTAPHPPLDSRPDPPHNPPH